MKQRLHIEITDEAAVLLESLMKLFGDRHPSDAIARALGLTETVLPFVRDGILTVVDPEEDSDGSDDDRLVDLIIDSNQHGLKAA